MKGDTNYHSWADLPVKKASYKLKPQYKESNKPIKHLFNRLNNSQLTKIIREFNLDAQIKPYFHKKNDFIVKKLLEHLTIDNDGYIVVKEHNVIVKPPPEGRYKPPTEEQLKARKEKKKENSKQYRERQKRFKEEWKKSDIGKAEEKRKKEKKEKKKQEKKAEKERKEKRPVFYIKKEDIQTEEKKKKEEEKNKEIQKERLRKQRQENKDRREKEAKEKKKKEEEELEREWKKEEEKERRKRYLKKNETEILEKEIKAEEEKKKKKEKYSYNKKFYDVLNNPNDDDDKTGEELYNEMFGSGFSTDIKKLILEAQKAGDFYYTPKSTVDFIYKQLTPNKTYRLLDPSAGLGNLLVGAVENQNNFNFERIDANDLNPSSMEVLKDNLKIDNYYINNFTYETKKLNNNYNLIIMNPPFSSEIDYSHNKDFVNKEKQKLQQKIKKSIDKKENIPDIKNLMRIDKANYKFKPEQKGYLFHLIKAINIPHTETKEIYSIMPFNWINNDSIKINKTYNLKDEIKGDLKERIKIALKIDDIPNIDLIPIKKVNDFYHLKNNGKVSKFGGNFYLFKGIIKKEEEKEEPKPKKEMKENKEDKLKEINKEIENMIKQLQKNNTKEGQKELKKLIDKQNDLIDEINDLKWLKKEEEDPKMKYIIDNKKKILDLYDKKSKELGKKYTQLQKEHNDLTEPYLREAFKIEKEKLKEKGIKMTKQRSFTLLKKVNENTPILKKNSEKVDKFGNEAQDFIDDFSTIKRKLTFGESLGEEPLTKTEIEYIYKNILN